MDFLNIKPIDVHKIIDDDFDLYTDEELHNLMQYMNIFNEEIYKITNSSVSIALENSSINILNYTNGELLFYFKEHPKN